MQPKADASGIFLAHMDYYFQNAKPLITVSKQLLNIIKLSTSFVLGSAKGMLLYAMLN